MSKPTLDTLSDRFLAQVAIAAMRQSTARAMRMRIDEKLDGPDGEKLSPGKRADMVAVCEWLRLSEREEE